MTGNNNDIAIVVLAAGLGTRMKSERPKVLHRLAGRPMLTHVLDAARTLNPASLVVVTAPAMEAVREAFADVDHVIQDPPAGTADAVLAARKALDDLPGEVLILFADTPLIGADTLKAMVARRRGPGDPAVVVLGFRPDDPAAYGRLVMDETGQLAAIVEFRDASAEERAIGLCNSGVMAVDGAVLFDLLEKVDNDNAKGEYYLTDIVRLARASGRSVAVVEADAEELVGINSQAELAAAEKALQRRLRAAAMAGGATLIDPESVWLAVDTVLEADVTVEPNVFFGPGVVVRRGAEIRAFSHIEGALIGPGAVIGPFARLRPGTDIGARARVGNFVEVKNAVVEDDAKANHLSYIGDAHVGARANVGAGTITCNYDGFLKHQTEIGADAFIGSNTALIAPVKVGAGAIVGAGSAIAKDVEADQLALTRAPQTGRDGWARTFRERKSAEKAARAAAKNRSTKKA